MAIDIDELNVIVFAKNSPQLIKYKEFFSSRGIRAFNILSEHQLENIIEIIPINGVVLDIGSVMKASGPEKFLISKLEEIYPTIRARIDDKNSEINCIYPDDKINTLDDFIEIKCANFAPRVLRTSDRENISFNIIVSSSKSNWDNARKSCTLNASDTGLFIISSNSDWKLHQKVFLQINELTHKTPIEGTVVRIIKWGEEDLSTPGISVRFDKILDSQQDELFTILKQ